MRAPAPRFASALLLLASPAALSAERAAESNTPPEADAGSFDTDEDKPLTVTLKGRDNDGDPISFRLAKPPKNGEASIAADGKLSYAPKKDFHGKDELVFEITDGKARVTRKAVIAVSSVNDPPTATVAALKGPEDKPLVGQVTAVDADNDPVVFAIADGPSSGVADIGARTGRLQFTPAPNATGTIKLVVRLSDGTVDVDVPVTIALEPLNDVPEVDHQLLKTKEDEPIKGKLSGIDVDNDALTWTVTERPTHGTLSIDAAKGTFSYTPVKEYAGSDAFAIAVSDGKATAKGRVDVEVQNVNDPPTIFPLALEGAEDQPLKGKVIAKDFDGDEVFFSLKTDPKHGDADLDRETGELTYVPKPNFFGTETFNVEASDIAGGVSAAVTVTIKPVNDAPVASADSARGDEDQPATGKIKATDVDKDALTYSLAKPPKHGTVEVKADGSFRFVPNASFNGDDAFQFEVSDGKAKAQATMTIAVKPVNDGPQTSDVKTQTNEDVAVRGTIPGSDIDKDNLTYTLAKKSKKGKVTVDEETGAFVYQPSEHENGDDAFSVKVADGTAEAEANVSVTIAAVNDVPVAQAQTKTGEEDHPVQGDAIASDVDQDVLAYKVATKPRSGTVALDERTGAYTYTPNPQFNGVDGFRFEVTDGKLRSAADVKLSIAAVNDAPDVKDLALTTSEDEATSGAVVASDIDKNKLTWSEGGAPKKGKLTVDAASGRITYTPNLNENGEDSFVVDVSDGQTKSQAKVTVAIVAVNDTPVAEAQESSGKEDEPIKGKLVASDVDKDALVYTAATKPRLGTVEIDPTTGAYTYTPRAHENGADSFRFEVSDGKLRASADVKLTVAAVNDAPDVKNVALGVTEDKPSAGAVAASDIDKDKLTWSEAKAPQKGKVTIDAATGRLTYTPNLNENGDDSFVIAVADGNAKSEATVNVKIDPVNDAPIADAHASGGKEDEPIKGKLTASDVDKDVLTYTAATKPRLGTVEVDPATGAYTFTPRAHENGEDGFRLEVSDGKLRASAEVKLTVAAVNDTPEPKDLAVTGAEDREVAGKILATDIDKDALTFRLKKPPQNGLVVVDDGTGSFRYAPTRNAHGKDSFVIEATDGWATADATVAVDVAAAPDAPLVDVRPIESAEDEPVTVRLAALDADEGAQVSFKILTQSRLGTAEIEADGRTLKLVPRADQHGEDVLVVEASDGTNKVRASLPVLIAPRNDPPTIDVAAAQTLEETPVVIALVAHDKDGDPVKLSLDAKAEPPAAKSAAKPDPKGAAGAAKVDAKEAKGVTLTGGLLQIVPPKDFAGPIEVNVTPSDPSGKGAPMRVVVTVVNVNDPPVAKDLALAATPDKPQSGAIEASDVDAGDELTFSVAVPPRHGSVVIDDARTGRFTYTAKATARGDDSFRIRVRDKAGASVSATVRVTLAGAKPVTVSDARAP